MRIAATETRRCSIWTARESRSPSSNDSRSDTIASSKVLKRYLSEELEIADPRNSPKPVFRLGYENDLFSGPLEQWRRYAAADRHIS